MDRPHSISTTKPDSSDAALAKTNHVVTTTDEALFSSSLTSSSVTSDNEQSAGEMVGRQDIFAEEEKKESPNCFSINGHTILPQFAEGETDNDDAPVQKLPLARLMERLRIHRTDSRLQDRVYDLIANKTLSKSPPLVLMTGPRGCGTSHVIRMSLQDLLDKQGGFFLQGKCHVHHNELPYPALVGAFTEFVHVVMGRGIRQEMRRIILDAIDPSHVPVLVDMIPALAKIIGGESSSRMLGDDISDASRRHQRFVFAFGALIQAICKAGRPIVLFLQDLNLCDASSLDYYSMLVTEPRYTGLILVGSCNSGVSGTSYLSRKLRQIEDQLQKTITNLDVNNLQATEVRSMMTNALELDDEGRAQTAASISNLVYEYTDGNLLLIVSLVRWLIHANLLVFGISLSEWVWNEEEIRRSVKSAMAVDDYVRLELSQLSEAGKETLQVAACLGTELHPSLLTKVLNPEQVQQAVQEASLRGLLTYSKITERYSFAHETVRVASYNLVPADEREQLHLKIGRRIIRALEQDEMEKAIFLVLSQLKRCQSLIKDDERIAVARLCLHAGSKAARSSANITSLAFLEMGLALLGQRCWRDEYDLTLALSNVAAEIHMCSASFVRMEEILTDIFANARTLHDKLPAYSTQLCGLAALERSPEALQLGKEALLLLGEPLPKRPSIPLLMLEMFRLRRRLKNLSDEQLLRLPVATDMEKISCMQLLHLIFLDASFCDPMYCPFIAVKLMRLTLKYGFSSFTAATFMYYAVTIMSNDVPLGLRYGNLSLKFLQRFGAKEFVPRVHLFYYGAIVHWSRPLSEAVQPLIDAYHVGLFTGDVAAAGLCASIYVVTCLEAGDNLSVLEPRITWLVNEMTARQQQQTVFSLLITAQSIHHYMGLSDDPLCPQGDLLNHDDAQASALARGNLMNALVVPYTRMIVALMFGDYGLASSLVDPYLKYIWNVPVSNSVFSMIFFVSMVKIGCARTGLKRHKNIRFVARALKRFNRCSPPNALSKFYLLKAELSSFRGDDVRALWYYHCARALAHQNGIAFMEALVDESFARHLYRIGDLELAAAHFSAACEMYGRWGATAKVRHLGDQTKEMFSKGDLRYP